MGVGGTQARGLEEPLIATKIQRSPGEAKFEEQERSSEGQRDLMR